MRQEALKDIRTWWEQWDQCPVCGEVLWEDDAYDLGKLKPTAWVKFSFASDTLPQIRVSPWWRFWRRDFTEEIQRIWVYVGCVRCGSQRKVRPFAADPDPGPASGEPVGLGGERGAE